MDNIQIFFLSKANWSLIGVFVLEGIKAVAPNLTGNWATAVQVVLSVLTLYLHPQEVRVAGQTGMLGGRKI